MKEHSSIIPWYNVDLNEDPLTIRVYDDPNEDVVASIWTLVSDVSNTLTLSTNSTHVKLGNTEVDLINAVRVALINYANKHSKGE